jgi:hypothetical protein
MNPLLLVVALTVAQPMAKEIKLVVHPAAEPRNLLRVQLLPSLLEQESGDCVALVGEAVKILKGQPEGPNLLGVVDQIREDLERPIRQVDRKQLAENLAKMKPAMDVLEKAARASRCDWSKTNEDVRTRGFRVLLPLIQELRRVVVLFAARARLAVLEDRPEDALRSIAMGMRFARCADECPLLICHLVGIAVATILLDQLDVVLTHPKCPNLYWALTALPQPFVDLRRGMDGERAIVIGSFTGLSRFVVEPNGSLPTEEEMKTFVASSEQLFSEIGFSLKDVGRLGLGALIQLKHETAIKELTAGGFPAEKMRQWPPLLVAIVHGLVDCEENLGRMQQAIDLPYWQGGPLLIDLDKAMRKRGPWPDITAPALPLSRLLLPAAGKVHQATARLDRRFAALRTIEALRLHASRTGAWPKTLSEIDAVPVPDDPVTGKPFEYTVEDGVAVLHGPRLTGNESAYFELYYRLLLK